MSRDQLTKSTLERRLSNLTVQTMRNYCDVMGIPGSSNMYKKDLVKLIAGTADSAALETFLSSCEAEYLLESFRKAVKWGKSTLIVRIDPNSTERELHAEFNGLDVGLKRVFYVDFFNVNDSKSIQTFCECDISRKKGLFCPHQMAVLLRGLNEGFIAINRWRGPMTPEVRDAIISQFPGITPK